MHLLFIHVHALPLLLVTHASSIYASLQIVRLTHPLPFVVHSDLNYLHSSSVEYESGASEHV